MPDFSKAMKTFTDPKKLFKLLRSPYALVGLLGLGFAFQVFRFGKSLFLHPGRRLWIALALLVIAIVILILVKRAEKKKKAKQIEDSLLLEADSLVMSSSGAQRTANERAREELAEAIENLKKSKLAGGRSGATALSVLPWFLVLGKAGSGRSKMIRNSGLSFPGSGPQDARGGKGVGPGQNLAWWFTNEAVVLEANGRFADRDDDAPARHDWQGILEVIAKARGEVPLQGIVVTVSAEDLIRHDVARLEEQARVLRQRLDATIGALKAFTPVHLVISKVDLVHGFQEFFSDLAGNARDQVLGATLDPEQVAEDPVRAFSREFDTLYRALCDRRIPRLAQEDRLDKRARIYLFPLEFVALRKKLRGFAKILFEPNPYGERPLFRGFFFASGSLEGEPVEMVLNEVSRVIGLPPDLDNAADVTRVIDMLPDRETPSRASASSSGVRAEADPRFLRELFTRVLPTSAALARPTEAATRRRQLQRFGLLGGGVTLAVLLAVFLIISFIRNGTMISHTVGLAREAALVPANAGTAGEVENRLRLLEPLRDQLDKLDRWDHRTPFTLDFGLYHGRDVNKRARAVYANRLSEVFLGPSRRTLETWLFSSYPASPTEYNAFFDKYRAYLYLLEPQIADSTFLTKQLVGVWSGPAAGGGATEGLRESIRRHVAYAWRHPEDIAYQSAQLPPRNPALVDRAGVYVRQFWRPENFYIGMIEEVNGKLPPFSIASVPGGSELLASDAQIVATKPDASSVPGAFTLKGWREEVAGRIQASEAQLRNDPVLKDAFQGQALDMRDWLLQTYKKDYVLHWAQFLGAVDVAPVTGAGAAATRVRDLAQPGSPLVRLLETAASNLRFRGETAGGDSASNASMAGIEDSFAALHSLFAVAGEGKDAHRPIDDWQHSLGAVVEALRQLSESGDPGLASTTYAKTMLVEPAPPDAPIPASIRVGERHVANVLTGEEQCAAAVRAILRRPAEAAWGGVLHEAQLYLDAGWGTSVSEPFRTLTGKYPMLANGPDCPIEEFNRFFAPGGVFWKFYDGELAPFLDRDGHAKVVWAHGLAIGPDADKAIRKAILFRDALFRETPGTLSCSFRLKPAQTAKVSGTPPFIKTTSLTVGDARIVYDMGLSKETRVVWPGETQTGGARVSVTADGPEPDAISFDGPWALFRLLDRATVEAKSESEYRIRWNLERKGSYAISVPYDLRASAAANPFASGFFQFDCPRQISPVPGAAPSAPPPSPTS
ncbi:MAG: type VI secretion system membrane subunit TssM [bacterium]